MAVTINEMEVTPAEKKVEAPPERGGGEAASPSPEEIQRMVEQQVSRCERVWAY